MIEAELPPVPLASALTKNFDATKITKENLDLSSIGEEGRLAFLLHGVFTPEECERLIKISEDTGYTQALVDVGGGKQMLIKGYRDGLRVLIDDPYFVRRLLQRISPFIPETFGDKKLVEINERLRFLRYDPNDQFKPHCDASYTRPDESARTLITLQMYLNEGFVGGETTFLERRKESKRVPVVPQTGTILVFEHNILHEGSVVKSGKKFTVRTDVLYTMNK